MLKLTAASIGGYFSDLAVDAVNQTLEEAEAYARGISPTDTGEYINNHKQTRAVVQGGVVIGKLSNDSDHANILEYGVLGRSYNYHKGPPRDASTVIYSGVGNRTYQRTIDVMRPVLSANLLNAKR